MADLSSEPKSIQSIYSWFRNNKLYVNRRYQRKLVWTLEEKQKLIESILKRYPIPAILIAEREEVPGTYEIIDGLQRLHAIVSFVETSFPTTEGKCFDVERFPTAKSFLEQDYYELNDCDEKLSQDEVSTFMDYTLAFSVMRNAKDEQINDVFDRINTYGHRLSDQERRQAGIQSSFSDLVRNAAVLIRGDVSDEILSLQDMPSISVDLPLTKHGYNVKADEIFWVQQGILRSTDLRDSMDEQCIADISACIVGGVMISRSKSALDKIFDIENKEYDRINDALNVYSADKFSQEFKYVISVIEETCNYEDEVKLRDLIFKSNTTNPFPAVFAVLFIAIHELIFKDEQLVSDYSLLKNSLKNLSERIETGRSASTPEERRKNVDSIKGMLKSCFVDSDIKSEVYDNHTNIDIENSIRRSEAELPNYELKQGLLRLDSNRTFDSNILEKITKSIVAIANNGPRNKGKIIIGVTDSDKDAGRIEELDGITVKELRKKKIVGVNREISQLGMETEDYIDLLVNYIRNANISDDLKSGVLSNIDFNEYYGYGLIVISIPNQRNVSYFNEDAYYRQGSSTMKAEKAPVITSIAQRFSN